MEAGADSAAGVIHRRKDSHLDLVLSGAGAGGVTSGLETVRFEHCALPELDFDAIEIGLNWLGKQLAAPFLIGAMTGGPARAGRINHHLAEAAEELHIALAVGSQRVALEEGAQSGLGRAVRRLAPSVPLLSNLGAAQVAGPNGESLARRAVDQMEADALVIHLNPLQEALQPEGDRNWIGVLDAIGGLSRTLAVPIIVKEVGAGISAEVAKSLIAAGVSAIEIAGAGGTSWAAIEAARARTEHARAVAEAFANWGIPTAHAIAAARNALPDAFLIASGGVRNGVEVAKAIRLGADLAAQAAGILDRAMESTEAVVAFYRVQMEQLRTVCFCTGSANLSALRSARLLPSSIFATDRRQ